MQYPKGQAGKKNQNITAHRHSNQGKSRPGRRRRKQRSSKKKKTVAWRLKSAAAVDLWPSYAISEEKGRAPVLGCGARAEAREGEERRESSQKKKKLKWQQSVVIEVGRRRRPASRFFKLCFKKKGRDSRFTSISMLLLLLLLLLLLSEWPVCTTDRDGRRRAT